METQTVPAPSKAAAPQKQRVLIVEDIKFNRELVEQILCHDYHIDLAWDGLMAIEKTDSFRPSLILMDISLPRMDGLEATRRIRAKHGGGLRIVALSAHAYPHDIRLAKEAGVDDYLTKPFLPKDLLTMVRKNLAG